MWPYTVFDYKTFLLFTPFTVAFTGLLWRIIKRYPSTIIMQPTRENQYLISECSSLVEYRPTPWIFNGHIMTVFGVLFRPLLSMSFERVLLSIDAEGGTIAIDWHRQPRPRQPVLLILHGLTGGSDNEYIRWMISYATSKLDLCCVVTHARGCGKSKLTSPKSFNASNTDHVQESLKYIRSRVGDETPIFAVGYSLGAGILAKFLGKEGSDCSLQGAIVCCASFDMHLSSKNLERWLYIHIYNRRLTNNLIRYLRQHEDHFSRHDSDINLNLQTAYRSKTLREFDKNVIVPMHGFRDVEHYYSEASSHEWIKYIRIPTLILSAADDPICPIDGLPVKEVLNNASIIAVKTLEGGHVSYLQGWWPRSFSYDNIVVGEYIQALLKKINYKWP
ncbi:unnamed protein product [Adineta ricciae]|uniref:AB hydrolase-1 domain-containing protein n=1 Tax=Adineta ricciae TaxID=249248 RepID=A0A815DF03_ADIRI|nr:unnamed protein product [Adineta ricciae]CAF1355576.1 unnamed protein product [Adineta ricciae]